MIVQEDIIITDKDYLNIHVVGYENQGESIIISIGNKFLGVIDCFKVSNRFETKRIIEEIGIPLDFICWTHVDWDHTYGLSDLSNFCNENTAVIIPAGLEGKEIRNLFFDNKSYQHMEYRKIYDLIDNIQPKRFVGANEHSEIYNFAFKRGEEKIDFIMKSFAPYGWMMRERNQKFIKSLVEDITIDENKQKEIGYTWYDGANKENNIFSIGLEVVLKLKNEEIRLCFTGDLDNDTIEEIHAKKRENLFGRNTFFKIPHHGSENADKVLELPSKNKIKYKYAVCTTFKNGGLPKERIIELYKKQGSVYKTNQNNENGYGIVTYSKPLIENMSMQQEIFCVGDARESI